MSDLSQTLDVVLEEAPPSAYNATTAAGEIVQQLEAAQRRAIELQNQLNIAHNKMCGELALSIRRMMPGLNVGVSRDGCKVGYRTKHLVFQPDSRRGIWNVKSGDNRFARKFMRHFGTATPIAPDLDRLVAAIVTHFKEHYKSLGEDIIGTGVVLVEGSRGTITDLAIWYESQKVERRLNSRLVRANG